MNVGFLFWRNTDALELDGVDGHATLNVWKSCEIVYMGKFHSSSVQLRFKNIFESELFLPFPFLFLLL